MTRPATARRPLEGLRVFELSSFVAAPLGGMTLAQLGADVIRIDPLGGAADRQRWPTTEHGASLYWAGLNKGKRSMTVDHSSEAGRRVVRDLVAASPPRSAVVLTNAAGQEWLSYEALSARRPDLIHVQINGHADGSPAVDYTINAEVGFPLVTGPSGHTDPVNHVLPAWDIACGLYSAAGVCAAARRRDVTGEGGALTVALEDVALATAGNLGILAEVQLNHVQRQRIGNHLYGGFARDFQSADGARFMVVALTRRHWHELVAVTGTGIPVTALEQALDADFSNEGDRFEYREVLAALFQRWFSTTSEVDVVSALSDTAVLWSRYRTFTEAVDRLRSPDGANPMFSMLDQPGVGLHLAPGSPLVCDGARSPAEPAPLLGEHTEQILRQDKGIS